MKYALGLVLAITAVGCHTTGGKLGGTLAGTGAMFGLMMTPICAGDADAGGCSNSAKDTVGVIALGAIVTGVAIAIISEATYKPPAIAEPAEPMPSVQAQQLTAEARQAAERGQCATVPALAQEVNALDAGYYTRMFYADPVIQRCIQAR